MRRKKDYRNRILWVALFLLFWSSILVVRLYHIQILRRSDLRLLVEVQHEEKVKLIPRRGRILDSKGRLLAVSLPVQSAFLKPPWPSRQEMRKIASVLGLSSSQLRRIRERMEKGRKFIWLKRKLTDREVEELKKLNIESVDFQTENKRFYPHGPLACHILGGVGIDEQGLAGVEYVYDREVGGRAGEAIFYIDAKGEPVKKLVIAPMEPGADLVLTIDATLQSEVEKSLLWAVKTFKAARAAAVIMDPYTGEILAMASYPFYDPNYYSSYFRRRSYYLRNNAISFAYEPGSVVKFVPAAAVLELGLMRPSSRIYCEQGQIKVYSATIKDHRPFGLLTLEEVLIHSSNVGAIKLALKLTKEQFYSYLNRFGFGRRTGVDLPGEARGYLPPPSRWYATAKAYYAIGQGFSTTLLQLTTATAVIANGGYLVRPHVVREVRKGSRVKRVMIHRKRVLSERVAGVLRRIMVEVVERGTGRKAALGWVKVGGKTGTAEKVRWKGLKYSASFVGFAPGDRPAIVVGVFIDEPRLYHYGGEVAAPVFRKLAEFALMEKNIFPVMVKK